MVKYIFDFCGQGVFFTPSFFGLMPLSRCLLYESLMLCCFLGIGLENTLQLGGFQPTNELEAVCLPFL